LEVRTAVIFSDVETDVILREGDDLLLVFELLFLRREGKVARRGEVIMVVVELLLWDDVVAVAVVDVTPNGPECNP